MKWGLWRGHLTVFVSLTGHFDEILRYQSCKWQWQQCNGVNTQCGIWALCWIWLSTPGIANKFFIFSAPYFRESTLVMGRAGLTYLYSAHWSSLRLLSHPSFRIVLLFSFCTLKFQCVTKIVSFKHICTQKGNVNFEYIKTTPIWAGWRMAWLGLTWLDFLWTGLTRFGSRFWLFCPSVVSAL